MCVAAASASAQTAPSPQPVPVAQVTAVLPPDLQGVVHDDQGRPVAFIPVEMRANSFHGALSDGDRVEIDASWRQGETVETKRVRNATTGGSFEAKRSHRWLLGLLALALFIVVVVVGAGVALWQLHEHNKFCDIHPPIVSKCT